MAIDPLLWLDAQVYHEAAPPSQPLRP